MNRSLIAIVAVLGVRANDNDAFIPEIWAQESLMILEANTVAANLVHRDFSNEIQEFGDTVHTRRPQQFDTRRKTDSDEVVTQDAQSTNVKVELNQHLHVSFVIKDGESSKAFKDLRRTYLVPAVQAIARGLDQIILLQRYQFASQAQVGDLGTAINKSAMIGVDTQMNTNLFPTDMDNRHVIVTPQQKGQILDVSDFTNADKLGDDGTAMRTASIGGGLFGANYWMSQNCPTVASGGAVATNLAVNNAGGYAAGTTQIAYDGAGSVAVGQLVGIGDHIYEVTADTGTVITLNRGLDKAVADDAVISIYPVAAVNNAGGYAGDYSKEIEYDGGNTINFGMGLSLGGNTYGALQQINPVTATSAMLDRPLEAAVADDAQIGLWPGGNFGWAFHRNSLAFVSRPLAAPPPGTGAISAIANMNGMGLRVVMTYDGKAQGTRVTVDVLGGVKVLDERLGFLFVS